ncbi:hypothetical protein [Pseudomonas benzopyrenica]|uniref:hypothetical protein n=1 Tax=Pseudomonas benzopyrenica TaxID=2993566 RepID=UPI00227FA7FB|nr:hypothetical protein [Pseudomonas benzopyrenica]MDC7831635.1 hypothetical protein [Pseudomonas benzopyrenica]
MTINDKRPKPICECGDPDCLKGSQTFTPDNGQALARVEAELAECSRAHAGLVDELRAFHAQQPWLLEAKLAEAVGLLRKVAAWPEEECTYGQEQVQAMARAFLARHAQPEQQEALDPSAVRKDAERWRYGAEHGFPDAMRQIHPVEGPVYWVRDWQQDDERFETAEAAIDAAMCRQAGKQEAAQ